MPTQHILTPEQSDGFINTCKYPLLSGGFGSGKSEVMHLRAVTDFVGYAGIDIAIYAPSYDLLTLNNIPRIETLLTEAGVKYELNKGRMSIEALGLGKIIFRSMANPERIIAYEVARSYIDEIDTMSKSKAELAWNKIIARNRQVWLVSGDVTVSKEEQVLLTEEQCKALNVSPGSTMLMNKVSAYTTPEGFNFTYDRWVVNPTPDYSYVKMPTWSNPHLPADYVQSIRDSYPKALADAYLAGEWVNLTNGSVYSYFDRKINSCDSTIQQGERLIVGMDFNVERACAVVFVKRRSQLQAVDEVFNAFDTNEMITILHNRYDNNHITIYPDKTGRARKSVNATESDIILLKNSGFEVKEQGVNPPIKERVVACNNGFEKEHLAVNVKKCPNLTTKLETQTWDGNGMPKKDGTEDINDAFGYPVHALYRLKRNVNWARNTRTRIKVGSY